MPLLGVFVCHKAKAESNSPPLSLCRDLCYNNKNFATFFKIATLYKRKEVKENGNRKIGER